MTKTKEELENYLLSGDWKNKSLQSEEEVRKGFKAMVSDFLQNSHQLENFFDEHHLHLSKQWRSLLTSPEGDAIKKFCTDRRNFTQEHEFLINQAVLKNSFSPRVVYRGFTYDDYQHHNISLNDSIAYMKFSTPFSYKRATSTSEDIEVAFRYYSSIEIKYPIVLELEIYHGGETASFVKWSNEAEVIIPASSIFEIVNIFSYQHPSIFHDRPKKKITIIQMKQIYPN